MVLMGWGRIHYHGLSALRVRHPRLQKVKPRPRVGMRTMGAPGHSFRACERGKDWRWLESDPRWPWAPQQRWCNAMLGSWLCNVANWPQPWSKARWKRNGMDGKCKDEERERQRSGWYLIWKSFRTFPVTSFVLISAGFDLQLINNFMTNL